MSRVEAFLGNAVQMAGPLFRLQKRIVAVKLHPDAVSVLQLHADVEKSHLERIVTWSLENDIGRQPVHENYRFLVDQITAAAGEAGIDGVDAGISVPANLFDTRVLTLPYFSEDDLIAEAQEPEFWEEFDPELTGLEGRIVKFQQIYANENEDRSVILFSSIPEPELARYRGVLLDSNLLPVFIENELFSLVNGIYSRLPPEDLFKPFCVFHLCPGSSMVVGYTRGQLCMQKVDISEFDEALLLELEEVDEVSGDFWDEVSIRISEQVKQAIAYMVEEQQFPTPERVFLVSEHKLLDNTLALLDGRFDAAPIVPFDALENVGMPPAHTKYVDYFQNETVFTSALGLATQGLNVEGKADGSQHRKLISMNFLDAAPTIRRNRQLAAVNRILSACIIAIMVLSGGILGFNTVPTFLDTRAASQQYDAARAAANTQSLRRKINEKKLAEINAANAKVQSTVVNKSFTLFLESLPSLIPAEAELQELSMKEDGTVMLTGLATSNSIINNIKKNFKDQKFTRRDPKVTTQRDGDLWNFSISANLLRVN